MLSRCLRGHDLIKEGDLNEMITKFKDNIKTLLISDFLLCLKALQMNDPFILAFDVFNVSINLLKENRKYHIRALSNFL